MLPEGYEIRPLGEDDAPALAAAYVRNREHLASWDPRRDESFFTERGQRQDVEARLTATGRGLAGAAVGFAVESADALGLHRLEAGTLVHNVVP